MALDCPSGTAPAVMVTRPVPRPDASTRRRDHSRERSPAMAHPSSSSCDSLAGLVAVLDTTTPAWVLNLDSGSSADDQCWALLDVLRVLAFGPDAAEWA